MCYYFRLYEKRATSPIVAFGNIYSYASRADSMCTRLKHTNDFVLKVSLMLNSFIILHFLLAKEVNIMSKIGEINHRFFFKSNI